jgi:hypothetical protein
MAIVGWSAAVAHAQKLSWNPVVTAAGASDSNVFGQLGKGSADRYATFILDVPIDYKPGVRLGLRGRYLDAGEAYQRHSELTNAQARQQGQLGLLFAPRQRTKLHLDGSYGQTNRPSEVFSDTGIEFGRERTTDYLATAGLNQGLSSRSTLNFEGLYRVSRIGNIEDRSQAASASLLRNFSRRTALGLNWRFERRSSETHERFDSNIASAIWNQEVSSRLSFSVSAGARIASDAKTRPEGHADVFWRRTHWEVQASYGHTLGYVPQRSDLPQRLGSADSTALMVRLKNRHWRLTAGPSWFWTRNDSLDLRVVRVLTQVDLMVADWLGLSASYAYQRQNGTLSSGASTADAYSTRSVGRVGIVLAPWNRHGAEGLP